MEDSGRGRRSSSRERSRGSPERARAGGGSVKSTRPVVVIKPTFRKVQVVYYLCRNGLLEHPHYMEVTHLAHQPLRLKDVLDRLTVLRGKGMPPLYSWSCKRSYKNGYVWNDLGDNDVIYPSEGAEYVLKGSEIIQGCTEKFQSLQVSSSSLSQEVQDPTFQQKRKSVATKRQCQPEEDVNCRSEEEDEEEEGDEDNQDGDEGEYEAKTCSMSMTPPKHGCRCSSGVPTETELAELTHKNTTTSTELTLDDSSPPSTTSSTISDKANDNSNNNVSKRFEDGDPICFDSSLSRNSVLLQFITCGGSASFRATKTAPVVRQQQQPPCAAGRKSTGSDLHKGVLCKTAAKAAEEEEAEMISCMSENPRFGNLQAEEKEYFSGSIVEAMGEERAQAEPMGLKRSNSYNEERCSKGEMVETGECEPKQEKATAAKAKCIPRMKSSSSSKQTRK